MEYLATTGDRLHDLELDRIISRLAALENKANATSTATPAPVAQTVTAVVSGVRSITPGTGTQMQSDITLAVAGPLTIAQSGTTITITDTVTAASTVTTIGSANVVGVSALYARADHVHQGVHKITGSADAFGDVVFTGAGVSQTGNTFTFAAAASSTVPANVLVISPDSSMISWVVPASLTEFNGDIFHRAQHDLTNATQARILIFRTVGPMVTVSPTVFCEYSTNSGSTWTKLDGASGPSVTYVYSSAIQVSSWVTLTAGAKTDVLLRISASGGDGAQTVPFGSIYVQVK